jgi:hypothetical protein
VVIALVLPEPEEPDPELEELDDPEVDAPELDVPGVGLVVPEALVVVVAAPRALWASAGSWPDTSWKKIAPQSRANVEAAAASARFRINVTRRRRAFKRAVTPPGGLGCLSAPGARVVVRVLGEVIVHKPRGQLSEGRVTRVRNSYEA